MAHKTLVGTAVSVLLLAAGCSTVPERRVPKRYTIEQFLDTTSVAGSAFSPDESKVLFSSDASGVFNAYEAPVSGGPATQLTDSSDTTFAISYFPEDERILLRRDKGGNEIYHIYLRETNGTVKDLTPGEKNRSLFYGWAHDLKSFFYMSNARDPRYMDLYEMDLATLEGRMIYRNTEGYSYGPISNDKRWLVLVKVHTDHNNDLYLYDFQTKKTRHLTPHEGDINYSAQDFSPDGKSLYYTTNEGHEFSYLVKRDLATDEVEVIEKPDWDVMFASLSWNGKFLVVGINEDARTRIKIYETATGNLVKLPELPAGDITSVTISRSERKIAFYHSGARTPRDLYIYDLGSGELAKITDSQNPEIDPQDLADAEVVRFQSFDGLEIPAILYKPHLEPGEKAPALVQVHGGPGGQSRIGYDPLYQYLVNHGYVVLRVNNRGSSGYGKTFYRLDDHKHGQDDLMDCVKAKDYLISTGFVDPERIGIIGGSYGGYMVLAALAFQPEVFDAGVDIFGVANWVRTLKSIPPWWAAFRDALYAEIGNPETEEEYLRKISPLFHASNIKRPLIVLQGANDPRVLKVESDEIVEAVRKNGVPVEYVVFDDEGHGFTKKANRIRGYKAIREFLDKHLKNKGQEA